MADRKSSGTIDWSGRTLVARRLIWAGTVKQIGSQAEEFLADLREAVGADLRITDPTVCWVQSGMCLEALMAPDKVQEHLHAGTIREFIDPLLLQLKRRKWKLK